MASTEHSAGESNVETGQSLDMALDSQRKPSIPNSQRQPSTPIEMAEMAKLQPNPDYTSTDVASNGHVTISHEADYELQKTNPRDEQVSIPPATQHSATQGPSATPILFTASEDPINPKPSSQTREAARPAIGPAIDTSLPTSKETEVEGPVLHITLLLTTGARHPFRLDQRYLKKRSVEVEDNNPINMSLYKLKELILRDWREEWETKPSSPESIRLISMGKLLTDKSKLADFGFKDGGAPSIIHMTIKPQDIIDEEEANKNARDRDSGERSPGCRCTIM